MKKALITGVAGQDGSYLAEFLLGKGYEVHGTILKNDENEKWRLRHIESRIMIYQCDVREEPQVFDVIKKVLPDECYHLASRVEPRVLFEEEKDILKVNFESVLYFLRGIKIYAEKCRFFLAGSSLMFGMVEDSPQSEKTPFRPDTPYGIAKTAGANLVDMYRKSYGVFGCTGILYNHESPRRDFYFLPRKITSSAAKIKLGIEKELELGNIDAQRDWGFAGDYVEAMWMMLQQERPEDYVIGTGELHSIKDILDVAFKYVGMEWNGFVKINSEFIRKTDPQNFLANTEKIRKKLGWIPKVRFKELIEMMVENDLEILKEKNRYDKTH